MITGEGANEDNEMDTFSGVESSHSNHSSEGTTQNLYYFYVCF